MKSNLQTIIEAELASETNALSESATSEVAQYYRNVEASYYEDYESQALGMYVPPETTNCNTLTA